MLTNKRKDYSKTGVTIQRAMIDFANRHPDKKRRPDHIIWNGLKIKTSDMITLPVHCNLQLEFLSSAETPNQGFDIKVYDGWIELKDRKKVELLRTWNDPVYEPIVTYKIYAAKRKIGVWNSYRMKYPGGRIVEERWTENAGFWVEKLSESCRVYHCSPGWCHPPDFEQMIVKLSIVESN